jgi:hypothetical protein
LDHGYKIACPAWLRAIALQQQIRFWRRHAATRYHDQPRAALSRPYDDCDISVNIMEYIYQNQLSMRHYRDVAGWEV